jgi:hypothetical protein
MDKTDTTTMTNNTMTVETSVLVALYQENMELLKNKVEMYEKVNKSLNKIIEEQKKTIDELKSKKVKEVKEVKLVKHIDSQEQTKEIKQVEKIKLEDKPVKINLEQAKSENNEDKPVKINLEQAKSENNEDIKPTGRTTPNSQHSWTEVVANKKSEPKQLILTTEAKSEPKQLILTTEVKSESIRTNHKLNKTYQNNNDKKSLDMDHLRTLDYLTPWSICAFNKCNNPACTFLHFEECPKVNDEHICPHFWNTGRCKCDSDSTYVHIHRKFCEAPNRNPNGRCTNLDCKLRHGNYNPLIKFKYAISTADDNNIEI